MTPTKPSLRSRLPSRPLRSPRHPHPLPQQRPPPRRSRSLRPTSPLRPRACPDPVRPPRARRLRSPPRQLLPRRLRQPPRRPHRHPLPSPRLRPPHRHPPRRLRLSPRPLRLPAPSRVADRVPARARLRSSSLNSPSSRRHPPRPPVVSSPSPWCRRARRLPSPQARAPRVLATTPSASVAATLRRRAPDPVPARGPSRAATAPQAARSPATRVRRTRAPVALRVRVARVLRQRRVAVVPAPVRVVLVPVAPVRAVPVRTRATCPRGRTPA